jgi:hypothetical protein
VRSLKQVKNKIAVRPFYWFSIIPAIFITRKICQNVLTKNLQNQTAYGDFQAHPPPCVAHCECPCNLARFLLSYEDLSRKYGNQKKGAPLFCFLPVRNALCEGEVKEIWDQIMMIWFGVQENYEDLFPRRHESYTYQRLLQVIFSPPSVFKYFNTVQTPCAVHVKIILEL